VEKAGQEDRCDVAVLGAGAAGLFCAGLLAQSGLRVVVLDHAPQAGRKILISGGGRANFTNLNTRPEHFLSENRHFAKSALARYSPAEFVALVDRHGIAYHEKGPGQLFCDGSARQIVEMLLREAVGATLRLNTTIESVSPTESAAPAESGTPIASVISSSTGFALALASEGRRSTLLARRVVVATGGLSIPKLGATGFGYEVARRFGLRVVSPRPALVPLTFGAEDAERFEGLSGVAAEVEIGPGGPSAVRFRDKLLVTHRGLSGPAVLQASSYWQPGAAVAINFAPGHSITAPLREVGAVRDAATANAAWCRVLPRRLGERLLALSPPARWTNAALDEAEHRLHAWPVTPNGTEGFAKAEVTAGGVATEELHAGTLESRKVPGLYFIGEVVDVTGQLGGYNFQWAWASGAAAARGIQGREGGHG
jgi:predicted Rossmann fold flavoprotein